VSRVCAHSGESAITRKSTRSGFSPTRHSRPYSLLFSPRSASTSCLDDQANLLWGDAATCGGYSACRVMAPHLLRNAVGPNSCPSPLDVLDVPHVLGKAQRRPPLCGF